MIRTFDRDSSVTVDLVCLKKGGKLELVRDGIRGTRIRVRFTLDGRGAGEVDSIKRATGAPPNDNFGDTGKQNEIKKGQRYQAVKFVDQDLDHTTPVPYFNKAPLIPCQPHRHNPKWLV